MISDERGQFEAAMDRLLAGTLLRSGGELTIVSLAIEAGVKRHVLTHKHTDLKDRFYARARAQDSVPASEAALREQIADLRSKLDDMRGERDEYKYAAQALAPRPEHPDHRKRYPSRPGQVPPAAWAARPTPAS
jgi:hypothetical protein